MNPKPVFVIIKIIPEIFHNDAVGLIGILIISLGIPMNMVLIKCLISLPREFENI